MLKKFILVLTMLVLSLNFTVSAENIISLTAPDGFLVHSKNPEELSKILKMNENELSEYCADNNILYLAVDSDNSRQIRITTSESSFSNSIINLSHITDDKIISLAPEISGIDGVRGETVSINGQKFLKIQVQSADSGGDFILTQYITVADRQNFIISFYSDADADLKFIEKSLYSLSSPLFAKAEEKTSILFVIIPVATVALLVVCLGIAASIIIDIKKQKENAEEPEEEIDEE